MIKYFSFTRVAHSINDLVLYSLRCFKFMMGVLIVKQFLFGFFPSNVFVFCKFLDHMEVCG